MSYQKRMEEIENDMDHTSEGMKWHEDKIKRLKKKMEELQWKWDMVAAEKELELTVLHLRKFFEYARITDYDPQREFLEYIRCVLAEQVEGEIKNVSNLLKDLFKEVEQKD